MTIKPLKDKLPGQRRDVIAANLKSNWYFPVSATAYFCLSAAQTTAYVVGVLIAFAVLLVIAALVPSIWDNVKKSCIGLRIVSALTAIGVCMYAQSFFYTVWSLSSYTIWNLAAKVRALEAMLPVSIDLLRLISVVGAVAAFFFVYTCVLLLLKKVRGIMVDTGLFRGMKAGEIAVYAALLVASLVVAALAFAQTEAFYGTEHAADIIYTSDSSFLVKGNAYLTLTHLENDLRQPLFAVFAAPFAGIPYLIGRLISASPSVQAMLINSVQIAMLLAANYMLAKMMKLDPLRRVCFMLLTCSTYTYLLFILMMEQYLIAYFWLIFCLYLICEKKQPDRVVLWGAGGTLLTSMVLLPFMSEKSPFGNFKAWLHDMVKYGLEFVVVLLAFCRFDVIVHFITRRSFIDRFVGKTVTLTDKAHQYTEFVHNCFVAPNAGVNTALDHATWQLHAITGVNRLGVAILVLVIVGTVLNRDKKSSLLAAGWVGFSAVLLLGFGWGTQENGLILYAMYFGWAFMVALFQLIEKIEGMLNLRFLLPAISLGCTLALAAINIPAIMDMLRFAVAYYPA